MRVNLDELRAMTAEERGRVLDRMAHPADNDFLPPPAIMLPERRRYGFFWGKRCEDVEDDLFRAKPRCVPGFYGLITPWFALGVLCNMHDWCLDWNAAEEDDE
jgi:hypothetical protein